MINREHRLQAGGLGLLLTTAYPHPRWCMVRDAASPEPRGEEGCEEGRSFSPPSTLAGGKEEEEVEEDGVAGITSHGGL